MTMQDRAGRALLIVEDLSRLDQNDPDFEETARQLHCAFMDEQKEQETNEYFQNARLGSESLLLFFILDRYDAGPLILQMSEELQKCVDGVEG